jgi:hypothetical protein
MENQLDKLFRDKLASHPLAPPSEAWAKIEAGMAKKNRKIIFWRVAAAFLLLGLLTAYYLQYNRVSQQEAQQISEVLGPHKLQHIHQKKANTDEVSIETVTDDRHQEAVKTESVIIVPSHDIAQENHVEPVPAKVIQEVKPEETVAVIKPAKAQKGIKLEITLPDVEETNAVAVATKGKKPVVVEYTLESVDDETVLAQKEKNSGLKKVWAFAKDLNSGESQFSLRGMKNDLFAFDFRKDSTKKH